MKKVVRKASKATALLMLLMMLVPFLPLEGMEPVWDLHMVAKAAEDADARLSVDSDTATAVLGSELTFKVYVNSSAPFTGIQFDLDIPAGLAYVEGSGKVIDGVKEELDFAEAEFTELTKRGTFGNNLPYSKPDRLALVEFKCRVDSGCKAGEYMVSVNNVDVTGIDFNTIDFTAVGKKIQIAITADCSHIHTTHHAAVESTCTVQGNGEYVSCDDCGKIISGSDEKLPLIPHTSGGWIIDKKATFTEKGSKHKECTMCKKVMMTEEIALLIEYQIVDGANGIWQQGEGTISFRTDSIRDKFEGVKVDAVLVDESNYDIIVDDMGAGGSVGQPGFVITLKEDYLNKLSGGIHNIMIVSSDGEATTTFEVKRQTEPEKPDETEPEKSDGTEPTAPDETAGIVATGDNSNFIPLVLMVLISACMFAVCIIINGIKRNNVLSGPFS